MLSVKEIVDAVNRLVVRQYPDRTVYRDVCPEQFERPSIFIRPDERSIQSESVTGVSVTQSVLIQMIDQVDEHYEASTNRLYGECESIVNALLVRGVLDAADRHLTVDQVTVSRALDVADILLTVRYKDNRPSIDDDFAPVSSVETSVSVRRSES